METQNKYEPFIFAQMVQTECKLCGQHLKIKVVYVGRRAFCCMPCARTYYSRIGKFIDRNGKLW